MIYLWSVTEGEIRVLKCLGRFKVRADVKDGIFVASLAFILFAKEDFSVDWVLKPFKSRVQQTRGQVCRLWFPVVLLL